MRFGKGARPGDRIAHVTWCLPVLCSQMRTARYINKIKDPRVFAIAKKFIYYCTDDDDFSFLRRGGLALPAVNCVSSSSVNAVLEAARAASSPVMLQVSNGKCIAYSIHDI